MAEEKEVQLTEGKITPEALEEFRKRIGIKLRVRHQFNDLVCKSAIRHFADGIGDINPLYRDEEYARKTRYGNITAPPSWLYSVSPTWVQQGLPGVHGFHSGNDWTFYRPLVLGDVITPEITFTGFEEKTSQFADKIIIEYQEARFFNQASVLIAKAKSWLIRAERKAAREKGKYHKLQLPHPYTEEELKKIEEEVLAEEVRSATPRFWEDVQVGEELPPVIKGPFGLTDEIAFCAGCMADRIYAHGMALRTYRSHPAWAFRDPDTYALEPIAGVHWNKWAAKAAGLPYIYDIGIQRQSWVIHLLTNWMGDEGWLKKNYAEYRKFVYFSDTVWLTGKVTKKHIDEDGEHCVDIETHGFNQRGEDTVPGYSTVVLPSREKNVWPLEHRLKR